MAGISSLYLPTYYEKPAVSQLVERFLDIERTPIKRLEPQKKSTSERLKALDDLKSKLNTLNERIEGFTDVGAANTIGAKEAVSSNEDIFTVEAASNAILGVNTIFVESIARNDIAVSDQFDNEGTDLASRFYGDTVGFSIQVGDNDAVTISITFDDSDETNESVLGRIMDEINNSDAEVSANVIANTPTTSRLTIVSDDPGSTNAITLRSTNGLSLGRQLGFFTASGSRRSITSTRGGFVISDTDDLNAQFTINGIDITSDTNDIEDIITGVTIHLRKAQDPDDSPETLTVTQDKETIKERLEGFIEDYNAVIELLNNKTSIDSTTYERGPLAGNFTFTNLKINLRSIVVSQVSTVQSGNPSHITELGVEIKRDGTLTLDDEDALTEALEQGSTAVTDLFNSTLGIATRIEELLDDFISTGGIIDDFRTGSKERISSIQKRTSQFESRLRFKESGLRQRFTNLQKTLSRLGTQEALIRRVSVNLPNLFGSNLSTSQTE